VVTVSDGNDINYNYGSIDDVLERMKNSNNNIMSSVQDLHRQVQQNVQNFNGTSSGAYEASFRTICGHLNGLTDRLNNIHHSVNTGANALHDHDHQLSRLFD
jgi:WXG100 family type VII secretion target